MARNGYGAAQKVADLLDECKPKTVAFGRMRGIRLIKFIEDVPHLFRRHADAAVLDADRYDPVCYGGRDRKLSAVGREFERIGDEIVPHDTQEAFVACDKKGINVDMFFFPDLFKADNAGTERFAQVERTFCTGIFWCSRRLRCKIFVTSTVSLRAASDIFSEYSLRSSSLMPSLCSIVS